MRHLFTEGNPGRPHGAKNKITKAVKEAFGEAFERLQEDADVNLVAWGRANPNLFYPLAAKLIPIETNVAVRRIESLSEEQTRDMAEEYLASIRARAASPRIADRVHEGVSTGLQSGESASGDSA